MSKKYVYIRISVCSEFEAAKDMMKNNFYDVVLFSTDFDSVDGNELSQLLKKSAFGYISEINEVVNEKNAILKYSTVTELYAMICGLYEEKNNRIVKKNSDSSSSEKSVEIITFMPVQGGAGNSTMAAACAAELSKKDSVLYVDFQQIPSDVAFFEGEGDFTISDIISMLRTKYTETGFEKLLRSAVRVDKKNFSSDVSFISGYGNIMDCLSMTEQVMGTFLEMLRSRGGFRYIIIDTDFIIGSVLQKLISLSDRIVFVSTASDTSEEKFQKIMRYFEIIGRNPNFNMPEKYIIFNKYSKKGFFDMDNVEILGRIPRYRTNENTVLKSHDVINEVLKKNIFSCFSVDENSDNG